MFTELDIINSMLSAIGVTGLTSEDNDHPDYAEAKRHLHIEKLSIHKLAHWYNTSYPTFTPNTSGEILLPNSTILADPVDTSLPYFARGRKMYNNSKRSFDFTGVCPFQVKLVQELPLEDMPPSAQDYLRCRAVHAHYLDNDGEESKLRRYELAKSEAWQALYSEHLRNIDVNARNSPSVRSIARGRSSVSNEQRVQGFFNY